MGLPAPILSAPSILYLGLAAYKYSNQVHLSMLPLEEMLWPRCWEYMTLTNKLKCLPSCRAPPRHFCLSAGFSPPPDWIYPLWHIQSVGRLADWFCDYRHRGCVDARVWVASTLNRPWSLSSHLSYVFYSPLTCGNMKRMFKNNVGGKSNAGNDMSSAKSDHMQSPFDTLY